jgi:DUF971 family protein
MTHDPAYLPLSVEPTPDASELRIRWRDGHVSDFPPRTLRIRCPCAGCVDERTGEQILRPEAVSPAIHPLAIHYVGRYALRFDWSDGHGTGIFPFDYLRRLCPCARCRIEPDHGQATPSHQE